MSKKFEDLIREACASHPKGRPFDAQGRFLPDPRPVAAPVGYSPPQSMAQVAMNLQRQAAFEAGLVIDESFEEADDFEVVDDPLDPTTPYEQVFEGRSSEEIRRIFERTDALRAEAARRLESEAQGGPDEAGAQAPGEAGAKPGRGRGAKVPPERSQEPVGDE